MFKNKVYEQFLELMINDEIKGNNLKLVFKAKIYWYYLHEI
jgi:hypothetical protein